jgi:hypothetical protein
MLAVRLAISHGSFALALALAVAYRSLFSSTIELAMIIVGFTRDRNVDTHFLSPTKSISDKSCGLLSVSFKR